MATPDKTPQVLGLIPARGGSKSILKKNIIKIGGKPLVHYSIEAALASSLLTDFIVSTDCNEIAAACKEAGANVPFLRPKKLATDNARVQNTALHALDALDPDNRYDYLMLLQPTAPFRTADDIDNAIRMAVQYDADCVVSFMYIETYHPYYMYFVETPRNDNAAPCVKQAFDYEVGMPKQEFPKAAYRNGAIYLVKTSYFKSKHSFVSSDMVPYFMPMSRSVNIDDKNDLAWAEFLLSQKKELS